MNYLSNGTEGEIWMSRWCYECVADHGFHVDDGDEAVPCLIQMDLYHGEPNEALTGLGSHLKCSAFSPCNCKDDG